jgi:hypothetical protein
MQEVLSIECLHNMISGPPTLVNLSNTRNPKNGLVGSIDNEDIEKSEAIVLFIN